MIYENFLGMLGLPELRDVTGPYPFLAKIKFGYLKKIVCTE